MSHVGILTDSEGERASVRSHVGPFNIINTMAPLRWVMEPVVVSATVFIFLHGD